MYNTVKIAAVDLYCGAGGLTRGLVKAGIDVRLGVDLDPACEFPYVANNSAKFLLADVAKIDTKVIRDEFKGADFTVLAGCAPCQQFSHNNVNRKSSCPDKWKLVRAFAKLVIKTSPDIATMENVPYLVRQRAFKEIVGELSRSGYKIWFKIVDAKLYGVPQTRKRLVLLASKLGDLELIKPTHGDSHQWRTVRQTISGLPRLVAGGQAKSDKLHLCSEMTELNLERIRASNPGGTWHDWPEQLRAKCHVAMRGRRYVSVYGRMEWDKPAPTITTQAYGFGNGRFGHPTQARGLSLREAAMLQTFPKDYKLVKGKEPVQMTTVGRLIGNAVPVRLGEVIGRTIVAHVRLYSCKQRR